MNTRRGLQLAFALTCSLQLLSFACSTQASAQERAHKTASVRKTHDKKKKQTKKPSSASGTKAKDSKVTAAPATPGDSAIPATAGAPALLAADDAADVKKEGGTEVKVLEFNGLDIEGQLKTPQMLYFLNRLRAEFGRPRLPHRSFMPELQRATRETEF